MRKFITTITLLACFGALAQKEVAKNVTELLGQNVTFKPYSVLTASQPNPAEAEVSKVVEKASYATIKMESVAQLFSNKDEYIEINVPYQGQSIPVQLYKVDILAEGFHVDTDKAKSVAYEPGVYYRGIVKNDLNSLAAFSFFNNELYGMISGDAFNNLVIGKLNKAGNTSNYIIYSDADMKVMPDLECHAKDGADNAPDINKNNRIAEPESTRCVTMYFEIDYNLYQQNGNNTTTTTNWMTSVFNNVKTLYTNDGITISLKSLYIWTSDDPYTGSDSSDYLFQFNDLRPVFDGDVGQLVGIDPGGLGGVAVTIDGLCSQDNYSYSDVSFTYQAVPTYSWTIMVITHEFGHLLGSPHTHACAWNGNNTPIDNCGPYSQGETGEGYSCISNPPIIPAGNVKGTIMSYCHLVSGVGINLANGFGPLPTARLVSNINNSNCLSTDCVNTCINTIANITVTDVTSDSATVNWTDIGGATTWQVAVVPFNGSTPIWIDADTNSHTFAGLDANTYYRFMVRPICGFSLIAPNEQRIFATETNYCNGAQITDTGGIANDYTDSETYIRTLIPSLPNNKITLTFASFDLEEEYDYFYVYDGNSTSATDLSGGGFTGNIIPGPFESTAADGSLTIKFYSDGGVIESGYIANVACTSNLGTEAFEANIDFTYFPNPTSGFVTIASKTQILEVTIYNPEGRLLYKQPINGLDAKVDMASFATGTYFFKLKFADKEANFKILKSN